MTHNELAVMFESYSTIGNADYELQSVLSDDRICYGNVTEYELKYIRELEDAIELELPILTSWRASEYVAPRGTLFKKDTPSWYYEMEDLPF